MNKKNMWTECPMAHRGMCPMSTNQMMNENMEPMMINEMMDTNITPMRTVRAEEIED